VYIVCFNGVILGAWRIASNINVLNLMTMYTSYDIMPYFRDNLGLPFITIALIQVHGP